MDSGLKRKFKKLKNLIKKHHRNLDRVDALVENIGKEIMSISVDQAGLKDNPINNNVASSVPSLLCPVDDITDSTSVQVDWQDSFTGTRGYLVFVNGQQAGTYSNPTRTVTLDITPYIGGQVSGSIDIQLRFHNGDPSNVVLSGTCTRTLDITNTGVAGGMTFTEIAATAPSNFKFTEDMHYVAQYLYWNIKNGTPVAFWQVSGSSVVPVDPPEPGAGATMLPAPSGGDDSAMIQSALNSGGEVVGTGAVYSVGDTIDISNAVKIWDMPVKSIGSIGTIYNVTGSNVEFYRSKIDADQNPRTYNGWNLNLGADNFVMCDSGFCNMLHKDQINASGVRFRGAKNWHITRSEFVDILSDAEGTTNTTRANAFWSANNTSGVPEGHGIVSSCFIRNLQSNSQDKEAEVFTSQNFDGSTGDVVIIGNWMVDPGKRLLKSQHPNNIVMGNHYHWDTENGPLTSRKMLNIVNVQLDGDNTTAENNYFKLGGGGRWESCYTVKPQGTQYTYNNLQFNSNDIEIIDEPAASYYGRIVIFEHKVDGTPDNACSLPGSDIKDNRVYGKRCRHFFQFSDGYEDDGTTSGLTISGNTLESGSTNELYQGSPATTNI